MGIARQTSPPFSNILIGFMPVLPFPSKWIWIARRWHSAHPPFCRNALMKGISSAVSRRVCQPSEEFQVGQRVLLGFADERYNRLCGIVIRYINKMVKGCGIAKRENFGFHDRHSNNILRILERIVREAKVKGKVNIRYG